MKLAILLCAAAASAEARDVYFDNANVLRPAFGTTFRVDDHRVELTRGSVLFHVANSGAPPVEIVTPSVVVQPFFAGDYRIEVNRFGETIIVPYGGDIRVVAPNGSQWLAVGQKMIARGSPADPEFRIVSAVSRWQRLADRIGTLAHTAWTSGGGSVDSGESVQSDERSSKPAAKSEPAPRSVPAKPSEGSGRSAPAPSTQRGK
jgi:hypothetical protein